MSTTDDLYNNDYYYDTTNPDMTSENTTTTEPNSTYTSTVEYSSATYTFSSAAPPRRVLDQGEDEFVFHAMYAIIGVVCFIVIAIAACFVYRSKKRASANLRRVRPRSRAGVLSLELLERDLLQGGLPHPASQPLYGLESVENTELSDTSSALMRTDSNNPNTTIRNHLQENGATPSVQQLANHFQTKSECRESIRNKDKTKRNNSSRSNDSITDNGIEHTINENNASDRPPSTESTESKSSEIMKPKKADSPKVNSKGADRNIAIQYQNGHDDCKQALKPPTSLQLKQGRFKQRTSSSSSAERQSPVVPKKPINKKRVTQGSDKGFNDEKQSSQLLPKMTSVSSDYENPDDFEQLKAPTHDHRDTPIYANTKENREVSENTGDFKSHSSTDINKVESVGVVLDINMTIPPPKPCKSDSGVGYINAPKQCSPSEDDDVFVKVPGYVNIPNVSENSKDINEIKDMDDGKEYENVTKQDNEVCNDKVYANITKQKTPESLPPPPTSCIPIYANTQRPPQVKRGYSASCLPQATHYETSWRASDGTLPTEYVDMGKRQEDNNDYMVMDNKENEYLDMSGARDNGVNSSSAAASDTNDHPHGYVNTPSDGNDEFYAVPRGNPYRTVGGNARPVVPGYLNQYKTVTGGPRCATGRSRSTDYIYDYADMSSVIKF